MNLTCNDQELEFLLNILERRHRDLLNEIAHTDHRGLKQALRGDDQLVQSLVVRLRDAAMQEVHQ